jgi:hypothetical protein
MKDWVEINRESRDESYCLIETVVSETFGEGVLITSSNKEGISSASVLYETLNRPSNLIYCNVEDENTVWFVIAKDGIVYGDHVIKLNMQDQESQQHFVNKLIQDIERLTISESLPDSVTIVCNDVKQNEDSSNLVLVGMFKIETPYDVVLQNSDFDIHQIAQSKSLSKSYGLGLSISTKFPVNENIIKYAAGVLGIICLLIIFALLPEPEKPKAVKKVKPPVVVDTFKKLKVLLTAGEEAVGIKQRFGFIINELSAARGIEGYTIDEYTANQEASSITLKRSFGSIEAVKQKLPTNLFYYQPISGGITLVRVTPKFPVFRTAVRANTFAEEAWIESALNYAWPDNIGEIKSKPPVKNTKSGNYTIYEYNIPFSGLFLEDFESMSSLFVGRSASFEELTFTVDQDDSSYSGEFKIKIIGVPDEHFGIKKRKK